MASAFGDLNGSGNQQIWLNFYYISYNQAGNYSTWGWEVRYYGNGWGSWGANLSWSLSGFAGGGGSRHISYDERYDTYTVLGGGSFNRGHNADGYLDAGWLTASLSSDHSSVGSGSVSVHSGTPPRIPKLPGAPFNVAVDQETTTSLRYRFSGTTDGGAPILEWQAQADDDPTFSSPITLSSNGTSVFTGLNPGTQYHFRSRGRNGVGWGPWSTSNAAGRGTTLPAVAPGMSIAPSLSGTSATVTLSPPGGVTTSTTYRVERRPVGGVAVVYDTATASLAIPGLEPGSSHEYRASAFIGSYQSPWTDWVLVTQPQPNTNPGNYFDGSTPDRSDTDFQWNGVEHNSLSIAVSSAPLGWRTFEDGNDDSGGDGVVARVTGGRSGTFGARVTFFTDANDDRFHAGTSLDSPGVSEVAEGGVYWGSIYVSPSRAQRMAAEIIWLDEGFAPLGASSVGDAQIVSVNAAPMTRLAVQGVAPSGAVYGAVGWTDVRGAAGTGGYGHGPYGATPYGFGPSGTEAEPGWSPWLGGDSVLMDDAMLSIGSFYDWFSGDTADTSEWEYSWLGDPNASISIANALDPTDVDPLADPDCPPIPSAPRPPVIEDDCIESVGSWRRYWAIIPSDQVTDWLDLVPTIELTTGALPARQVRIRAWRNPEGLLPQAFAGGEWEAEQIISYIPAETTVTLDGVAQRVWAEVGGAAPISADRLLYGTGGGPASWPLLTCGTAYLLSFDVPLDAPEGNLAVDVALTTRMM